MASSQFYKFSDFDSIKDTENFQIDYKLVKMVESLTGVTKEIYRSNIHGRIAVKDEFGGVYMMYENNDSFIISLSKNVSPYLQGSPLHQLILDPIKFINEKETLTTQLGLLLSIDIDKLDSSKKSLTIIEDRLHSPSSLLTNMSDNDMRILYKCLIRYLGDIYNNKHNKEWDFTYRTDLQSFWPVDDRSNISSNDHWANSIIDFLSPDPNITRLTYIVR